VLFGAVGIIPCQRNVGLFAAEVIKHGLVDEFRADLAFDLLTQRQCMLKGSFGERTRTERRECDQPVGACMAGNVTGCPRYLSATA